MFWRSLFYYFTNTFILPILLSISFYDDFTLGLAIISPFKDLYNYEKERKSIIYSLDLDRKWVINVGVVFIWV